MPLPADFCGLDVFGMSAAELDEFKFSFSPPVSKGFSHFRAWVCHSFPCQLPGQTNPNALPYIDREPPPLLERSQLIMEIFQMFYCW